MLEAAGVRGVATLCCGLAGLILVSMASVGCEARPRPIPERRHPDKQTLFADASLVPTREGERVRRELALAGELTTALELLGLSPVHVDVELRDGHTSAVVVAQLPADADAEQLDADVIELSTAIIPELAPAQIHLWLRPSAGPPSPSPTPGRPWTLMFACLGLGLSLGVTLERALARRR